MCRIASLFLLQRLKGSMSGDATFLVAVACFLPGRAKELPAPPLKNRLFTYYRLRIAGLNLLSPELFFLILAHPVYKM